MSQSPSPIPDYRGPRPQSPGLTPDQLREIALAQQRAKKIRTAATVAKTDGVITALFAGVCLLSFCMGIEGPILGAALTYVAFTSFRAAAKLRQFDIATPLQLALNQVLLAAAIITYAAYELWVTAQGRSGLVKAVVGDTDYGALGMESMVGGLETSAVLLARTVYVLLIIGTITAQGLTAWYYYSRRKIIADYLAKTPPWVVEFQKVAQT
jgi:hypothetical protein